MDLRRLVLVQEEGARPSAGQREPPAVEVRSGLIAIIGNSGSGKSSLLRMLESALRRRQSIPEDPSDLRPGWYLSDALVRHPFQALVATPQENELVYPTLTARENVLHFLRALPWDRSRCPESLLELGVAVPEDTEARALAALRAVGLEESAHQLAQSLSGGQKRRLLLAMDLALGPDVLVADEPLSQLDSSSASTVFGLLKKQSREGPVLFTVHQPIDEWVRSCDQVWVVESPSRVVSCVPGRAFVRAGHRLRAEAASDEQPAAYLILKKLKEPGFSDITLDVLTEEAERELRGEIEADAPTLEMIPTPGPLPSGRAAALPRLVHCLRHEVRTQFLGNLRSSVYWLMLLMFVGVTLFTNFVGGANELPFSIPLATNALLVSVLFIGVVSGVRIWSGRSGDRIRQLALRRLDLNTILLSKATPALLEAVLIAGLAWAGMALLQLREGARVSGWPDTFAGLPWLPVLPTVVAVMLYVGYVGWTQGMVISALMTLRRQKASVLHFRRFGRPSSRRRKSLLSATDPVQQAYTLAVLLVVGQIGLGGAFGQITGEFGANPTKPGALATMVVDGLASFSPLRWGYNAAVVFEWRQTRCRIYAGRDAQCRDYMPQIKLANECVPGGIADDAFNPSEKRWMDINSDACGRVESDGPREGPEPHRRNAITLFYQAGGANADRLDRIIEKRRLLRERKSPFPAEALSESFSAESWAKLNQVRLSGEPEALRCMQREANTKYEHILTTALVGKGMFRPQLVDVEWCWRSCPDVREVRAVWENGRRALTRGEYMLRFCPLPGEKDQGSGEVMKSLHLPIVGRLSSSRAYPCQGIAHEVFRNEGTLDRTLSRICSERVLLPEEQNLLFWMVAIALFWSGLAVSATLVWSGRLQHGG